MLCKTLGSIQKMPPNRVISFQMPYDNENVSQKEVSGHDVTKEMLRNPSSSIADRAFPVATQDLSTRRCYSWNVEATWARDLAGSVGSAPYRAVAGTRQMACGHGSRPADLAGSPVGTFAAGEQVPSCFFAAAVGQGIHGTVLAQSFGFDWGSQGRGGGQGSRPGLVEGPLVGRNRHM